MSETRIETRARYPHFLTIPTRRMDNDIHGQVNNVVHYCYFDTVIDAYLIGPGGLDIHGATVVGVCAESACRYRAAFAFPEPVEAGLRVGHPGGARVRCENGPFKAGEEQAAARGHLVHVFVGRDSRAPAPIPSTIRQALERIHGAA